MSRATAVLYDVPGPKARVRNLVFNVFAVALMAWIAWTIYTKFDETGQWESEKWSLFLEGQVWETFLIPGIIGTLKAFVVGGALSMIFGLVFAVGRLSASRPVRWLSGAVVEFFRAIPLLLLMIFIWLLPTTFGQPTSAFWAVVLALMLYNGSVLAEVIRAGVNSLPSGQREAGLAVGLTTQHTMNAILLPQAVRAMLPAIVAQLVVVLKDTALGYIIVYGELLRQTTFMAENYGNLIPAAIVVALIYIVLNTLLGIIAVWLENYLSRNKSKGGKVADHEDPLLSGAGLPGGGGGGR